jgi:hypothetical protein
MTYLGCFSICILAAALASIPIIAGDIMNKKSIWETVSVFAGMGVFFGITLMGVFWLTKH